MDKKDQLEKTFLLVSTITQVANETNITRNETNITHNETHAHT